MAPTTKHAQILNTIQGVSNTIYHSDWTDKINRKINPWSGLPFIRKGYTTIHQRHPQPSHREHDVPLSDNTITSLKELSDIFTNATIANLTLPSSSRPDTPKLSKGKHSRVRGSYKGGRSVRGNDDRHQNRMMAPTTKHTQITNVIKGVSNTSYHNEWTDKNNRKTKSWSVLPFIRQSYTTIYQRHPQPSHWEHDVI